MPLTTWGGQVLGWRAMYGVITLMGVVALGLLARNVPEMAAGPASSPLRELGVLKRGRCGSRWPQGLSALAACSASAPT
ncbi:hypothetical protein RAA17_08450 [Komagataeibacter rhaeticus]|nr:hypothetical protein [Komagataeibacter rhaeticus]